MKLNKAKLEELASLDDAHLWQEIRSAAEKFGYTLPANQPAQRDLEKIRSVMKEADKVSAMEIAKLLSAFKAKKNKEQSNGRN